MAQSFSKDVAHITDGRFGGGSQYSLEFFAGRDKGLP
jgi:dihydroxyacid dehydratase/phosphogluconate dehydratase